MISEQVLSGLNMQYSKEDALKNVNLQNTFMKGCITQKLLNRNSQPLINFETNKIDIYFGVFFYQIIKSSLNQFSRPQFNEIMQKIQQATDNKQHLFAELCRNVMKQFTLNPFPDNFNFRNLDESIQESLEFEIYRPQSGFGETTSYKSTKLQSKEPIQFKIFFYQNPNDNYVKQLLIFSTDKNLSSSFQLQLNPPFIFNCQNKQQLFNQEQQLNQPRFLSFSVVNQNQNPNQVRATKGNYGQQQNQNEFQQTNQGIPNFQINNQTVQQNLDHANFQFNGQNLQQQPTINDNITRSYFNNNANGQNPQEFNKFNIQNQNNPNQFKVLNGLQQSVQNQGIIPKYNNQKQEYQQQNNQNNAVNNDIDVFSTEYIATKEQVVTNTKPKNEVRLITKCTSKVEDKSECLICCENYNLNQDEAIMTPCCSKMAHKRCMQENLYEKAKQKMNLETITCYLCEKALKEYQDYLRSNISKQLFFEIKIREVLAKVPSKCCKCNSPIQASQEYKELQIQCLKCNTMLCCLCYQEYHGENQSQCPNLFKEILKAIEGMPVLVCPFCGLMQTKDEKCNHVKCHSCQQDLCSACSVDRSPILIHGNHYHRVGCPDYQSWIKNGIVMTEPEFDRRNCAKCKETNLPCQYPISLEEYKKQKQF